MIATYLAILFLLNTYFTYFVVQTLASMLAHEKKNPTNCIPEYFRDIRVNSVEGNIHTELLSVLLAKWTLMNKEGILAKHH